MRFTCVPARASLLGFGCREAPHCRKVVYIQLVEVEAAFKNLKDDLQLRPIYHQLEHRVEAHILVCSSDCSWFARVAGGRRYDLRRLGIRAAVSSEDICSSRNAVVPAMSFAA